MNKLFELQRVDNSKVLKKTNNRKTQRRKYKTTKGLTLPDSKM